MWTSSRAWARRSSLAFYEVVMAKAFRTLVDDGTEVSVETNEGLRNHVERGLGRTAEAVQSRREAPSRSRSWPACGPRLPVRHGHRLGRWR